MLNLDTTSATPLRPVYHTKQAGVYLEARSEKAVSPLVNTTELRSVILLPYNGEEERFIGVNIIPTATPSAMVTMTGISRPKPRKGTLHKIKDHGGQAQVRHPLKSGEKVRIINNNNFPVYCVLVFA